MRYVDGFLLPLPTKNLQLYRRLAQKAGKIWRERADALRRQTYGLRRLQGSGRRLVK
jgi:uncharacterized protein YbaA (DUF1428 family)